MARRPSLAAVVEALEKAHGPPDPPAARDPWELILRENVVYLADDEGRERAFQALKKDVGTRPREILEAPVKTLRRISSLAGILADTSAKKVRKAAEIAEREFGGDLRPILDLPTPKAKRALRKFPGIGEPGAEKLLLFAGRLPVLALESNGLRVLVRLGFAKDEGRYAATYRAAQESAMEGSPRDVEWLTKAHQLLKLHGRRTCKNSRPVCEKCVLAPGCPFPSRR